MLEPQPRPATCRSSLGPVLAARAQGAHDDVLDFLQLAAQRLGEGAVAEPQHDRHGFGPPVGTGTEDAPGSPAAAPLGRELVIARALLGGQHLADAGPHRLEDLLGARLALLLAQPRALQRLELAAPVRKDRIELRLLLGGEPQAEHETLAQVLAPPRPARRPSPPDPGDGLARLGAGTTRPERSLRALHGALLL